MSIKLASTRVDLKREAAGDWVMSLAFPGVKYKVSSLHVPAYVTARQLLVQRLTRKHRGAPPPPEEMHREIGALLAQHILHDWEGFDQVHSTELGLETLTDLAYRNVASDIEDCAARLGEPDVEYLRDAEKNSDAPSPGN